MVSSWLLLSTLLEIRESALPLLLLGIKLGGVYKRWYLDVLEAAVVYTFVGVNLGVLTVLVILHIMVTVLLPFSLIFPKLLTKYHTYTCTPSRHVPSPPLVFELPEQKAPESCPQWPVRLLHHCYIWSPSGLYSGSTALHDHLYELLSRDPLLRWNQSHSLSYFTLHPLPMSLCPYCNFPKLFLFPLFGILYLTQLFCSSSFFNHALN